MAGGQPRREGTTPLPPRFRIQTLAIKNGRGAPSSTTSDGPPFLPARSRSSASFHRYSPRQAETGRAARQNPPPPPSRHRSLTHGENQTGGNRPNPRNRLVAARQSFAR